MSLNGSLVFDLCSLVTFPGFSHVAMRMFLTRSRLQKDDSDFIRCRFLAVSFSSLTNLPFLRFPVNGSLNHLSESMYLDIVRCSVPDP
jgi:hypothetical protein